MTLGASAIGYPEPAVKVSQLYQFVGTQFDAPPTPNGYTAVVVYGHSSYKSAMGVGFVLNPGSTVAETPPFGYVAVDEPTPGFVTRHLASGRKLIEGATFGPAAVDPPSPSPTGISPPGG